MCAPSHHRTSLRPVGREDYARWRLLPLDRRFQARAGRKASPRARARSIFAARYASLCCNLGRSGHLGRAGLECVALSSCRPVVVAGDRTGLTGYVTLDVFHGGGKSWRLTHPDCAISIGGGGGVTALPAFTPSSIAALSYHAA